ncbi:hypothetical protein F442_01910 [Phytophthora nicotianae P10297]|uniref:Uncharacterized protein n=1 Tax=Phytophthora nicotianae P10297 TaxID=1317064 RepID=W3A0T9_PHYNI|nr:hypothetical protein F442_01910 [Phytophthora nicotianae P10297]
MYSKKVWKHYLLQSASYLSGETVKSVFIFGYLEFLSFALLALMLYRRYGLQAFYHLAFVLETQVVRIQGKVIMWMLLILAFRVDHFA